MKDVISHEIINLKAEKKFKENQGRAKAAVEKGVRVCVSVHVYER